MEQELKAPLWIYEESFDEGWLRHDPSYARALEKFLRNKYAKRGIDIVMPMGDYPLAYMQKRRKTLLPDAKLIYFSMGHSPPQSIPEATGLVWKFDLAPTLEVALLQNPTARHVLLITGTTEIDRATAQIFLSSGLKYLQEKHSKVDLQVIPPGTVDETRSLLAALPQDTITVFIVYYGDSAGQGFVPDRILSTFSEITNRPMYSWLDTNLGRGAVGGSLAKVEASGAALGNLILRVLRGGKPDSIPEESGDFRQYEFDWQQMKRWGIGMDKVPAGSMVINREYTFWELYQWRVIGLLILTLVELALIVDLIRLTHSQRRSVKQLTYQRNLEALVSQVAAAFIALPAELVTPEIERAFQQFIEFFELDRITLFEFSAGTTRLRLLCSRVTTGVAQPPALIDLVQMPWTTSQILLGTPIVASRLDQLDDQATELRKYLHAQGIRSFAAFPLRRDGKPFATLGFSAVHQELEWNPDLLQALQTIAHIFGSALERKYAEEAVRESRNRLTGIIESAMDAIIAMDSQQRIVAFNATAEKMFRCPREEALGQSLDRFIPHRFRAQHRAHISRFAEEGVTKRAMRGLWGLRANGEEFPIDSSISQIETDGSKLLTVIIRDITERKWAEQALHQSEQLKASILESLSNHIAVVDSSGIVVAVNDRKFEFDAGNDLLGVRVGTNYFEMCRSRMADSDPEGTVVLDGMQAVFDGKRDYFELEYASRSATDQAWLLMSVTPLEGPQRGIVISHHDISEQKRHEQAIQELSGRLITAQEQERSRIARELHDDINQQLAVMAIELQQLENFFPEDSSPGRQKIQALWKKTNGVSMDLQHLSHQLHSAKLEHLGIIAALRGLCAEFSEQCQIEAGFQFRQVPPTLDSDISLSLFRVTQESLRNVAKHSRAKKVRVELIGGGENVSLRVADDGVGFDQKRTKQQTGLGLISMSERVRLVGGTLSVWSRPSMGTQVEAAIPLSRRTLSVNRASKSVSTGGKPG
jgi:PAS domain S-box-containing protein